MDSEEKDYTGKILVADEDSLLAELVDYHFAPLGFKVDSCSGVDEWLELDSSIYSLVIIDIAVDNGNGLQIIDMMRQNTMTDNIPIIICTKHDNTENIVAGLNAGADDYITRPFSVCELVARIKALLRRACS